MKSVLSLLLAIQVFSQDRECPRVAVCEEGTNPIIIDNCPSCRQADVVCTTEVVECTDAPPSKDANGCRTCQCPAVSECAEGTRPERDETTQCPSCKVVCEKPPLCETDERPSFLGGCITCKKCEPVREACEVDAVPGEDDSGCPTCRLNCASVEPCGADESPVANDAGCLSCSFNIDNCEPVAECADGVEPERDSTGCPTCTKPERRVCTRELYQQVPDCVGDEIPTKNEETGCPSCVRLPEPECTIDESRACRETQRLCEDQEKPELVEGACCATCRIPRDDIVCIAVIDPCERGTRPQMVDGCPSCYFEETGSTIDSTCVLSDCARPSVCNADEAPERINNCCLSCYIAKEEPTCSDDQKTACRESYSSLEVCADRSEFIFDESTCCYPCRKAELEERADGTTADSTQEARCTKEAFEACVAAADVCESGNEESIRQSFDSACCPTCTRPERQCDIETVVKCKRAQVDCATGETPVRVAGDCCGSCRVAEEAEPACETTTCDDDTEVCARRDNGTACAAAQLKRVTLNKLRGDSEECPTYTTDEVRDVVIEIVKRYCDKNLNVDNCRALGKRMFNFAIKSVDSSAEADRCVFELSISADSERVARAAGDDSNTRRKRSGDGVSTADIIADAFANDDEATGEFQAVVAGEESSAVAFSMGLAAVVAMLF